MNTGKNIDGATNDISEPMQLPMMKEMLSI
jgi:hypothetical protein